MFANEFLLSLDFCEYDSFVWIEIGLRTFLRRGRVFLSKSFTILTNMFLDLDFFCFFYVFFFGALNGESREVGYGNLIELIHVGKVLIFKLQIDNLNFSQTT